MQKIKAALISVFYKDGLGPIVKKLNEQGFAFAEDSRWYASPRRLAFILRDASEQLEDKTSEKRGPAVAAAYDDEPQHRGSQERIEIPAFLRRQAN